MHHRDRFPVMHVLLPWQTIDDIIIHGFRQGTSLQWMVHIDFYTRWHEWNMKNIRLIRCLSEESSA